MVKKNLSYTHSEESWCFTGVLLKLSDEQPRPFYWEVPHGRSCHRLGAFATVLQAEGKHSLH